MRLMCGRTSLQVTFWLLLAFSVAPSVFVTHVEQVLGGLCAPIDAFTQDLLRDGGQERNASAAYFVCIDGRTSKGHGIRRGLCTHVCGESLKSPRPPAAGPPYVASGHRVQASVCSAPSGTLEFQPACRVTHGSSPCATLPRGRGRLKARVCVCMRIFK